MTQALPGAYLAESMEGLQLAINALKAELHRPAISVDSLFHNLSTVIKELDRTKLAKPISSAAEYIDLWNEVLAGRLEKLEPRAIRAPLRANISWTVLVPLINEQ